jgi:vancomycin resistance protein YoaR
MLNAILSAGLALSVLLSTPSASISVPEANIIAGQSGEIRLEKKILASETMDLNTRYPVESVSEGFKENILIAVNYLQKNEIVIRPGEVFAFHKNIMPEFKKDKIITQESGFIAKDGYKYVAGLAGNGVCHLASLMNEVAQEAGLEVTAPTNHNFANIPGIDKKYGTSIKYVENGGSVSERQNLYIKNNNNVPIKFEFTLEGDNLSFSITS